MILRPENDNRPQMPTPQREGDLKWIVKKAAELSEGFMPEPDVTTVDFIVAAYQRWNREGRPNDPENN